MTRVTANLDRAFNLAGGRLALALLIPLAVVCCQSTRASDPDADAQAVVETKPAETSEQGGESNRLAQLNEETAKAFDDERYVEALRLGEEAYDLGRDTVGERHPQTMLAAHQLADVYLKMKRFDDAEILYRQALKDRRAVLGDRHGDTLRTLFYLADFYRDRGYPALAVPLFEETLEAARAEFGEQSAVTRITLNSLAGTYWDLDRQADAEPLYRQLLEIRRAALGDRHEDTRDTLIDLAWINNDLHRYAVAASYFDEVLTIEREVRGELDPTTLGLMNDLAIAHWHQGRNGEAEILLRDALDGRREVLGKDHLDTLESAHDLALIYSSQGLLEQARPLYEETLAIKRETLGDDDSGTLITVNNLANLYRSQGEYFKAEEMLKEAVRLYQEQLGKDHPDTLLAMNSLAITYQRRGRYGQAGDIYEEVLKRRREILGERHPDTLSSLHNLAHIYIRHTRYADAFPLYEQAFTRRREILGARHPDTLSSEFGSVYALMTNDRVDEAVKRLQATADDRLAYAEAELANTQGPRARNTLLDNQGHYQSYVLSLAIRHKRPETLNLAGDVMLHWKQLLRSEAAFVEHLVRTSGDPDVEALGQDILDLKTRLARVAQEEQPSENPVELLQELDAKELALIRISGAFKRRQDARRASIEQLQAVLPENSGVVEFRQFTPLNDQGGALGPPRFAALLVRPGRAPLLTNAGEVEDVERLLAVLRDEIVPARAEKAAAELRKQLFSAFGEDLDALERVYVAPDGILNLVPFDRLRMADGAYWDERQDLRILQASRDLLEQVEPSTSGHGLLALGGIDFSGDVPSAADDQPAGNQVAASVERTLVSDAADRLRSEVNVFSPLAGSLLEVAHIERLFQERRPDVPVAIWTGHAASEARLKTLGRQVSPPRILHIATHGFYLANRNDQSRWQLQSGIALAGANHGLAGGDIQGEDGILYSLEAESLNLEGTELVVLSACDTGQGVIDYSEGVVGMVRALRIAGAKRVLMTLWPISDQATAEFMRIFYHHWLAEPDQGPATALKATKAAFRTHPDERYRKPRIWAPFVLIGA